MISIIWTTHWDQVLEPEILWVKPYTSSFQVVNPCYPVCLHGESRTMTIMPLQDSCKPSPTTSVHMFFIPVTGGTSPQLPLSQCNANVCKISGTRTNTKASIRITSLLFSSSFRTVLDVIRDTIRRNHWVFLFLLKSFEKPNTVEKYTFTKH